jgi:2'-5' RNA ligase
MDDVPVGVPPQLRQSYYDNRPKQEDIPLALSLSQNQYVGTASDRQYEARQFTGWNYVSIAAVCKLASRATVEIFDDRIETNNRKSAIDYTRSRRRKSLIAKHGSNWKSFANKDQAVTQQADPSFRWWKLTEQPNPWQTGSQLRYTCIQQLRLHGIAFVWNVKNAFGKTVWRFPVPMALVTVVAPGMRNNMPMGGISVHSYGWMTQRFRQHVMPVKSLQYMASREISVNDLTIYAYPHPFLPGDGASPTTAVRNWIDLAQQAEQSQADQYDRGPDKKVIITPPEEVKDDVSMRAFQKRLDRQIRETTTGVIVGTHGGIHDLTVTPEDMAYDTASGVFGSAIMGAHGTPKSAVGMNEGMTYGSVAASIRAFGTLSVQSDLDTLADEDTMQMRQEEGDAFSLQYPCPPFDDPELKETQLTNDMSAGAITVGEWRIERGMEPFGDERDGLPAGGEAIKAWQPKQLEPGQEQQQPQQQAPGIAPNASQPQSGQSAVQPPQSEMGVKLQAVIGGSARQPYVHPPILPMGQLGQGLAGVFMGQPKSLVRTIVNPQIRPFVVAVDLDGTLSKGDYFDEKEIGKPRMGIVQAIRAMKDAGCYVVIYTCRDSDSLVAGWCDDNGVPFDAINENPFGKPTGGKMMADLYLDNRAVNAEGNEAAVVASIMETIKDRPTREAIRGAINKRRFDRMYGFLFVPVEGSAERIATEGKAMIDPAHLTGDGLESEPHITILHAVAERPHETADAIKAIGKFTYTVGKLETFTHDDGTAHVYVSVSSPELRQAYLTCERSLAHMPSQHSFNPHITLGVIDKKHAKKYQGRQLSVTGAVVNVHRLVYRPPGEADLVIPLR